MADAVDPTRSRMMAGIRGKNTKPELLVRRYLHSRGLRYTLHNPRLPGRPDLVLPKYNAIVFVNGCFWHQHPGCRFAYMPKSSIEFWTSKLRATVQRDAVKKAQLEAAGWRVFVIWECETADTSLERLFRAIRKTAAKKKSKHAVQQSR